jgi:hypothetical protein
MSSLPVLIARARLLVQTESRQPDLGFSHFPYSARRAEGTMGHGKFSSQGPRVILLLIVFMVLVWAVVALSR